MNKVINIQAMRTKKASPAQSNRVWVRDFRDFPEENSITEIEITPKDIVGLPCVMAITKGGEYVFPLTDEFEVHFCNEMLRSLNTGLEVHFSSFLQYFMLIERINGIIQARKENAAIPVLSLVK